MENKSNSPQWSKPAIIGFISSILWLYGVGSLLAIILGIISIKRINRSNSGKGFAIAGIILGGFGLILPLWILTSVIWTKIGQLLGNIPK